MELFDVIVVGAGPAGSAAAHVLGTRGFSVLLMERRSFPRPKPCAGWVSPWVFELIGTTPGRYAADSTLAPFSSLIVWDGRDSAHEIGFDRVMGYGVIRSQFDSVMVPPAGGVRFAQETPATKIVRRNRSIIINGQYKAPVVIGAGGHTCPVARRFTRISPNERYVTAVVSETLIGRDVIDSLTPYPDTPQIIFNDDFSGYGWYFPKGDYLNVGVGTTLPERTGRHRDALMCRLGKKGMLPDARHFPLNRFSGHAYKLMRVTPRTLFTDGILLAGDAGGVAYNMSGEGIGPAIFSGICAAETVIASNGDYSIRSLAAYPRRLYERFGRPYPGVMASAVSLVPGFLFPVLRSLVVGSDTLRRHVVARRWFFRD